MPEIRPRLNINVIHCRFTRLFKRIDRVQELRGGGSMPGLIKRTQLPVDIYISEMREVAVGTVPITPPLPKTENPATCRVFCARSSLNRCPLYD